MDNTTIPLVADNYEKHDAYQHNMQRFNKARKEGFYFEALWIIYAMIEDISDSFLFYIGFASYEEQPDGTMKLKPANETRPDVRVIIELPSGKTNYGFNSLGRKLDVIRKVLVWAQTAVDLSGYQKDLHVLILKKVKIQEVQSALAVLDEWRGFRNQIVHALFNKKHEEVETRLAELVSNGYAAVRKLDNAVKAVRRGIDIRKLYNIQ